MPITHKVIGRHVWNFKPNFKCSPLKFLWGPRPGLWCALASLGQCLASIKLSGVSTPTGWNIVSRKSRFGWVQTHMYYFMDSGPKFTELVSLNAGGIVLDHISFRFWISCLIPEIFTIRVGCCVKLPQILHVLASKIFSGAPSNFLTCIINCHRYWSHGIVSCRSAEGAKRSYGE